MTEWEILKLNTWIQVFNSLIPKFKALSSLESQVTLGRKTKGQQPLKRCFTAAICWDRSSSIEIQHPKKTSHAFYTYYTCIKMLLLFKLAIAYISNFEPFHCPITNTHLPRALFGSVGCSLGLPKLGFRIPTSRVHTGPHLYFKYLWKF